MKSEIEAVPQNKDVAAGQKYFWCGRLVTISEVQADGLVIGRYESNPHFVDSVSRVALSDWVSGNPVRLNQLEEGFHVVQHERFIELLEAEEYLKSLCVPRTAWRKQEIGGAIA